MGSKRYKSPNGESVYYRDTGCWLYPRCCSSSSDGHDCPIPANRCPSLTLDIDTEVAIRRGMKMYLSGVPVDEVIKRIPVGKTIIRYYIDDYINDGKATIQHDN